MPRRPPPCRESRGYEERWPVLWSVPTASNAPRRASIEDGGEHTRLQETIRQVLLRQSRHRFPHPSRSFNPVLSAGNSRHKSTVRSRHMRLTSPVEPFTVICCPVTVRLVAWFTPMTA